MLVNIIALIGSVGSLLGAYTLYVKAVGKNKTDIGAIVNEQIKFILEDKDGTIGSLRNDLDALNEKVERLLVERAEDKSTISRLTAELADAIRDKNYWKNLYQDLKRRMDNEH